MNTEELRKEVEEVKHKQEVNAANREHHRQQTKEQAKDEETVKAALAAVDELRKSLPVEIRGYLHDPTPEALRRGVDWAKGAALTDMRERYLFVMNKKEREITVRYAKIMGPVASALETARRNLVKVNNDKREALIAQMHREEKEEMRKAREAVQARYKGLIDEVGENTPQGILDLELQRTKLDIEHTNEVKVVVNMRQHWVGKIDEMLKPYRK